MENEKMKVLILFGGTSPEHEVSRNSAAAMVKHIDMDRFDVLKIGITKEGRWFLTDALPEEMADGRWETHESNKEAIVSPDRSVHGIVCEGENIRIDCVFPMFHGECGEDGTIQGLFEIAGLPYVGAGVGSSACSMDKSLTKILAARTGVRQAAYYLIHRQDFITKTVEIIDDIEKKLGGKYPMFVKPASTGSSVGISKVNDRTELFEGIKEALCYGPKVLVEEMISGREFETAVLGNAEPRAAKVGEVISAQEFYTYEAKYSTTLQKTQIVTDVAEEKLDEFRDWAVKIYKEMGCAGMARVDFFYEDGTGEVVFNELNTIPGFTPTSMYPQMWQATGLEYHELISKLIDLAMEEY
ncbi:MAG: D-alanine--D-alanine ligase [Firmicutes bacterium]|nr:D-alanine--D-alanine ligase [Bacillota bacterium]